MIVKAYTLLDVKTGIHAMPWFFPHDAVAIRAVKRLAQDGSTTVAQYPEDFVLYFIGEFDDNNAQLQSVQMRNLGSVATLMAQE